jgi:hypothetical protein
MRASTRIALVLTVGIAISGWGFFEQPFKPKPPVEKSPVEKIILRDIPVGMYGRYVWELKGMPSWKTADDEFIYEEETASYSVLISPKSGQVIKVCEVGNKVSVLGVRVGDTLGNVIETAGIPSAESLNKQTTEGSVFYTEYGVGFNFREGRVEEVCTVDEQQQQLLARR